MPPSCFHLEHALAAWRRSLTHHRAFSADDLDELEQHLRDEVADLVAGGLSEEQAYRRALAEMGGLSVAEAEYGKVYWGKRRRRGEVFDELRWRLSMLKNYLKITLRTLRRQKGYSLLNIAGLTLGMACCLLLFQYAAFERSYDQFNTKKERIVRPLLYYTRDGGDRNASATQGYVFGPTMAQEVPGVVRYARVHPNYGDAVLSYEGAGGDRTLTERGVLFVDSTFLSIFDYPLLSGDRMQALRRPQTLLLSASTARKYFGDAEAVGQAIEFTGWVQGTYTVAGVFEDVPPTSHLQFDVLLPMEDLLATGRFDEGDAQWGWQNFITYFEMAPNADREAAEAQLTESYVRYREEGLTRTRTQVRASLQPLTEIHLGEPVDAPVTVTGSRRTVYFLTVIGLITLVIALVNYVNLATARAMDRAREVGVRKVVGAQKSQLLGQFLLESVSLNALALGLAVGLSLLLLPAVNRVAGVEMARSMWLEGRFWVASLGIFSAGALLSGLYPAFVLSSFRPATVLKGKAGGAASRMPLRKVLVVAQFAASIALLVGTLVVYAQLSHMRSLDTGFDLEQVLVVEEPKVWREEVDRGAEMATLKQELQTIPAVGEAALSSTTPGGGFSWYTRMHRVTADPATGQQVAATMIDEDFDAVYGMELAAGEGFRQGMVVPDSGAIPVMVNEALVRALGFSSNDEAIDALITNGTDRVIRGVYADFLWSSAHQEAESALFQYDDGGGSIGMSISMKVGTADLPATLAAVEEAYRAIFPGNPFNYYFADAAFDTQYRADRRFATLFGAFTGVAVLIACLGLFGLASFTARQRTKEIGVRKVLGASVGSLVALLSRDFVVLLGIAFLIAAPVAYFYLHDWLESFAYHIALGPGVFLLAGAVSLVIALLTVSYQALRAALADPVQSLRYE